VRRIAIAGLLVAISLPGIGAEWRNAGGSEFTFEIDVEGVPTRGEFNEFDVNLNFDPSCPELASLRVTVNLEAADMGDPDMNDVLFAPEWLDVGKFNEAVFISDAVAGQPSGQFVATGALDLKGTVRTVEVTFSWTESAGKAAMQGMFIVKRTDFGIGSGEWASGETIGIDVALHFTVQLSPGK